MKICLVVSPPNSKLQVSREITAGLPGDQEGGGGGHQIMRGPNQMFT